jgi:hypothetical protein
MENAQRELVLYTKAHASWTREQVSGLMVELMRAPEIIYYCEVIPGPSDVSRDDTVWLDDAFFAGQATLAEFSEFCVRQGLPADPANATSAAAFLDSRNGVQLATLRFTGKTDEARLVYAAVYSLARTYDLRLVGLQTGTALHVPVEEQS